MSTELLSVKSVSKRFGSTLALNMVDFHVQQGEIVGLVGKNGAGKSTLIKVIGGATKPDTGSVTWCGSRIVPKSPRVCSEIGIAVLYQENNLAQGLTVGETIGLSRLPRRGPLIRRARLREEVGELLGRLGLAGLDPNRRVGSCSHVQQRMIMIAAALWRRSRLIVLDEPSASLTDEEITLLHRVVRDVVAQGVAVIYVSHRLDEVVNLTDRVVVMRDARVVEDRPTRDTDVDSLVRSIAGEEQQGPSSSSEEPRSIGREILRVSGLCADGVRNVSLSVSAGEIVGIAGLVGSGRTELLRAIYGAADADKGRVDFDGDPYPRRSPRESLRRGLALLSEDRRKQGIIPGFSVRKNITLSSLEHARHRRAFPITSARHESNSAQAHISSLGIVTNGDHQIVTKLSGGNQQKTLLARWINTRCKLLMLDEPTVGVDVGGKADLYRVVRAIAANDVAVLVVSSDFSELIEVCDRLLVMRDGELVSSLPRDSTETAILDLCYAGSGSESVPQVFVPEPIGE